MTRTVIRFVPYKVRQDPQTVPTHQVWCVSGDEEECGEDSGEWVTPHPVEMWMDAHVRATGHRHFRRAFFDNAMYVSPDGPVPRGDDRPVGPCPGGAARKGRTAGAGQPWRGPWPGGGVRVER
jgi:hypothetical protein